MKKLLFALLLSTPLFFTGCLPEDDDPVNPPQENPFKNENFYFQAILNSDPANNTVYNHEIIDFRSKDFYGSAAGASGHAGMHVQSMVITRQTSAMLSGGVAIMKRFTTLPIPCSEVDAMFTGTNYTFGSRVKNTEGAVVYFIDANGMEWASDKGLALQDSTAFFKIISHTPNTADTFSKSITNASFNCTLYDNAGRSLKLTDGVIRSRSVNCNGL